MLKYIEIPHPKALDWLKTNNLYDNKFHKSFDYWLQHIFLCRRQFPQLKKFIKSDPRWLAAYLDDKIVAVYYFTITDKEMFDGYLISHPDYTKYRAGLKLGKELLKYTQGTWSTNWSTCIEKYVSFNIKLGYEVVGDPFISKKYSTEIYLLRRTV
tara:strand:+ start:589 stop:1053 length:465 start_codon:yes stop_codon:yes gene_type:complete